MYFQVIFLKFTLLFGNSLFVVGEIINDDDDKLVLSSAELANLVRKEMEKNNQRVCRHSELQYPKICNHKSRIELTPELSDDETRLKTRKVWSRWGKWGECSVTCGGGTMRRQRLCLAGRCAPGEHEEQCRPCARSPCSDLDSFSDDTHDLE